MKLFHVDASPKRDQSTSRHLSRRFVDRLVGRLPHLNVDYLDLTLVPPPNPTETYARAIYSSPTERTDEMRAALETSDDLCARILAAEGLVMALPMHNFSYPSVFKAFLDNIVRGGVTYRALSDGRYEGMLAGKLVLFITSRGADLRPGSSMAAYDALTPALRAGFGFIGVTDPVFIDAQPMQFADKPAREEALARAEREVDAVADDWSIAHHWPTQARREDC